MLTLYAARGCGSMLVEAALELCGVDYERREVEYGTFNPASTALREVNPLAQVPTLVLDDGTVMTESVAIILWLLDEHPGAGLGPAVGDPERPRFLRWLLFFVTAIYPMYTIGDYPEEWVGKDAAPRLKEAAVARTLLCWQILEEGLAPGERMLGDSLSALDVYAAVLSSWRPGRDRIREVAPRAVAAAERAEAHPIIARMCERNAD